MNFCWHNIDSLISLAEAWSYNKAQNRLILAHSAHLQPSHPSPGPNFCPKLHHCVAPFFPAYATASKLTSYHGNGVHNDILLLLLADCGGAGHS
jgi:hypothetical protein